jgi:surface-adhesin protein E
MRLRAISNIAAALSALGLCSPQAALSQTPGGPPVASAASSPSESDSTWTQVAEDSQRIYYLERHAAPSATASPDPGKTNLRSLIEFKIPQVSKSTQVWSIVSKLQMDCENKLAITLDDTLYSGKMGAGRIVSSESARDSWHAPAPGSLGEMAWTIACGKG